MFRTRHQRNNVTVAFHMVELIYHSIVRNLRKQHRSAVIGLLMNAVQGATMIGVFYLMFQLLGQRTAPIRGDFMLYIISGVMVYIIHIKSVSAIVGAENSTSGMMLHAPMNTTISITAAAISTLYTQIFSLAIILTFYHLVVTPIEIHAPVQALGMVIASWFTGTSVGLVLLALKPWFPTAVPIVVTLYTRMNMITSGKMFVVNTLPSTLLSAFDWNPLFHVIDQTRGYVFLNYNPNFTTVSYPLYVGVAFVVIGLMGEFFTRQRASTSWEAGR